MNEYDADGNLTKLDPVDPLTHTIRDGIDCHGGTPAACQHPGCGKIMPRIWDVICFGCLRPFCYPHALAIDGKWLCVNCRDKV